MKRWRGKKVINFTVVLRWLGHEQILEKYKYKQVKFGFQWNFVLHKFKDEKSVHFNSQNMPKYYKY